MASGKTHSKIAFLLIWPLAFLGLWVFPVNHEVAYGIWCGAINGWLVTPDIDVDHATHEERRWYHVAELAGIIWQGFWSMYGYAVPHRGISHGHLIGTLTRAVYQFVGLYMVGVYVVLGIAGDLYAVWIYLSTGTLDPTIGPPSVAPLALHWVRVHWVFVVSWFVAWSVQDSAHILTDKFTDWKRIMSKRLAQLNRRLRPVVVLGFATVMLYIVFIQ